ncbi:MAG: elongation factor G [Clostridiales bacterium]|nr:elongation factor G [Clostridiales bacterium]
MVAIIGSLQNRRQGNRRETSPFTAFAPHLPIKYCKCTRGILFMSINGENIRNIAVVGHSGEGKTTLCEAMLFNGGVIDRMGKVTDGTTVSDFDDLEKAKKMSIYTSCSNLTWKGVKVNLLDLPGYYDFEGERNEGLRAAGGALLVIGANGVLPIGAESIVEYCLKLGKPLIIFINGMDKENADYLGTVQALKAKYAGKLAPIQIPIMENGKMQGCINALQERAYLFKEGGPQEIPIPDDMKDQVEEMKAQLMETAAENDEILLEKYFETGDLTREETIRGIRIGIASVNTIPVMAGSALTNRGVINLLNEIVTYMPQARERLNTMVEDLENPGKVYSIHTEENAPFAAQVFKTVIDPFSGKLSYLKSFRGVLKSGSTVWNPNTETEERIGQVYALRGKKMEAVDELAAGDIGAVNKLNNTNTGDTLCDINAKVKFSPIYFPKPTLFMSVAAEKKGEEDKVFAGLAKLKEEDYTFSIEKNAETGEMVLGGQGDTQLEILAKKVKARYGVDMKLSEPKIAYRETIRGKAEAEGKHKKQSGGHGQYGHVKIRFSPAEEDFVFDEEVVGGAVPKNYFPAVEKGLRESMEHGPLAGYPVTGLKAVLYDGSYHDVDSNELSFKMAASIAFKEGLKNAKPVLLEPVYSLKIAIPADYLGDVMGDINKRRGRIMGTDTEGERSIITAEVPLAEIKTYTMELRSLTRGSGKFVSEFLGYEDVPPMLVDKIVAEAQKN